jgi:prevent-host-death family protein
VKSVSAREAKYNFGKLIDTARAEPVVIEKHGRAVVVVIAVEEFERRAQEAEASRVPTFLRVARGVVLALYAVVVAIVIILLVNYVDFGAKPGAGSDALQPEAVAKRLQRVGSIELRDASAQDVQGLRPEARPRTCGPRA